LRGRRHSYVVYAGVYVYIGRVSGMGGEKNMHGNLVRKQYLVSEENVKKIKRLASVQGTSAAEIVRRAIEAYELEQPETLEEPELLQLVSRRLKEAISSTRRANRKVSRALETLNREAS